MFQLYSIHEKEGGILVACMQHNSDILNIHTSRLGPTDSLEFAKVPTKRFTVGRGSPSSYIEQILNNNPG